MRAALFDLDGTLLDTEKQYTIFWTKIAQKHLPDQPDFAQKIKGTTLISILSHFPQEIHDMIKEQLEAYEQEMDYPIVPGAKEFVEALTAKSIKCAIVTSSDKAKMEVVGQKQPELLRLFDEILVSEDFPRSKPDPDCYLRAAERLKVETDHCVVFEDAINGLKAAQAAEIYTIGLTTGLTATEIKPYCQHTINDFIRLTPEEVERRMQENASLA